MTVSFTPQARGDLQGIRDWIAQDDDRAADRVTSRILQTAMMLGQFPKLGRMGKIGGTREFSVTGLPYVIVYAIADDAVDVLTVMHTRRRYPPST